MRWRSLVVICTVSVSLRDASTQSHRKQHNYSPTTFFSWYMDEVVQKEKKSAGERKRSEGRCMSG